MAGSIAVCRRKQETGSSSEKKSREAAGHSQNSRCRSSTQIPTKDAPNEVKQ